MSWNIDLPPAQYLGHQTPGYEIQRVINEVYNSPVVAIDTETTGLVKWKDIPLYWSLAWGTQRATLHADLLPYFTPCFQNPNITWALANAKYDMHILANFGHFLAGKWHCVQVMHALLFDDKPHRLKFIAQHILGWTWADFQDQFGKISAKQSPRQLIERAERENFSLLVEYASNDAWGTLKVYEALKAMLERENTYSLFRTTPPYIETLWDFFAKVESPFTKVLWKMERRGIKVDKARFAAARPEAEKKIADIEREIVQRVGNPINPNSPAQVAAYAASLNIKPIKYTKGGKSGVRNPSWDSDTLEHYRNDVPVFGLILDHREYSKLLGTYIIGLHEILDPYDRIHSNFNQDVARCMPAGELVLTDRGYIPVEQVAIGDQVIAHTGIPRRVVETSKHAPKAIYSVTLSNYLTLRTTANHQYLTKAGWKRADELLNGDVVITHATAREQWRTVPGWTDFSVSSWGRVANNKTGHICTQYKKGTWGHLKVCLYRNGAQKRGEDRKDFAVHRLVLNAFAPGGRGEIRHLDGIAWNNSIDNLAYGTPHENRQDALKHGSMSQRLAGRTKLSQEDVAAIRAAGSPGQPPSSTSKLSYVAAEDIRARYASGEGRAPLAREYGVSYQAVDNIIRDKTWTTPEATVATADALAEWYGVSPGTIRDIWAGRRWQEQDYIEGKAATFREAAVCMIVVHQPEETYGLTVEVDHSHVTNGIVTHNTGRLSSSDPNLQNIPRPENDHWNLRGAFITEPGWKVIAADYSQLEMRLLAAAAQQQSMVDIFLRGWDIHAGNAALMFDTPYEDIDAAKDLLKKMSKLTPQDALNEAESKLPGVSQRAGSVQGRGRSVEGYLRACAGYRSAAKNIGFGLNYGMGPGKLANGLGISLDEAKAKIAQYKDTYPAVEAFMTEAVEEGRRTGYAFTVLGRRRNIPMIASSNKGEQALGERLAVNTQIQGSAADVTRMAQINIDCCGLDIHYSCFNTLQVHDELVFEVPEENVHTCIAEIEELMAHPFSRDLLCPLTAEAGFGDSWGEAK